MLLSVDGDCNHMRRCIHHGIWKFLYELTREALNDQVLLVTWKLFVILKQSTSFITLFNFVLDFLSDRFRITVLYHSRWLAFSFRSNVLIFFLWLLFILKDFNYRTYVHMITPIRLYKALPIFSNYIDGPYKKWTI